MLLLSATPRDEGQFRYTIERTGYGIVYSSENAFAMASKLSSLNVTTPHFFLARARDLGSVEIPEG